MPRKRTSPKPAKPKSVVPHPFKMTVGTPNEPGKVREYLNDQAARTEMIVHIRKLLIEWVESRNREAIPHMNECLKDVGLVRFSTEKQYIDVHYDEHYGMTMRITYWKEY